MIPMLLGRNLLAWSMQVTILIGVGLLLPRFFHLRHPRSYLMYCYILLAMCLAIPFIQPWIDLSQTPIDRLQLVSVVTRIPSVQRFAIHVRSGRIVYLLLAGVAVRFALLFVGLVRVRRFRSTAIPLQFPKESILSTCRLIEPRVEIRICANEIGPVTFGWKQPVILLPASFLGLDEEAQRAILCHEFLHVLRQDWITNIVEELIGCLFWFHPLVLRLLSQTRLAGEQLIDAEVVRITSARESYIAALLSMASAGSEDRWAPAPTFLRRRHLAQRMRLLVMGETSSTVRLGVAYSITGAALVFSMTAAFTMFPLRSVTNVPLVADNVDTNVAAAQTDVFTVENGMSPPRVINRVDPVSSDAARQMQRHGLVQLEGMVETDGRIHRLRVVQSVDPDLDQHAVDAVKQWQFEPGKKNGLAVPVRLVIDIHFSTHP